MSTAGRAHTASARALESVLADTLKGDSSLWKQQLCSSYTACNDRLAHDMVCLTACNVRLCMSHCTQ